MSQMKFVDFAVPAGAGAYAPEVLYLNAENSAKSLLDVVHELTAFVESLPAGAELEVDLLKADGTVLPTSSSSWLLDVVSIVAAGLAAKVSLSGWVGVRIRAKSGGNAGSLKLHAAWF